MISLSKRNEGKGGVPLKQLPFFVPWPMITYIGRSAALPKGKSISTKS